MTKQLHIATEAAGPKKSPALDFQQLQQQVEKLKDVYSDQNVYKETKKLVDALHKPIDKWKIVCKYRLALPSKFRSAKSMTYAGIELTEINMPQTLIKFLTTKLRASSSKNVTKTRLLAMLLAHEGFNVTFAGNRLRIKFDDNVKFATESLHS